MPNVKASELIKWESGILGCGYVYSAKGEKCTIELLKQAQAQYGSTMGDGYFQKNGDYTKGRCGKWIGEICYDCSGTLKAGRKALSGVWKDVSAQGLYDQCSKKRGTIANMQLAPGTLVFIYGIKQGRMVHVGTYIGGGYVIESRGVDYGVVKTKLSQRAWTHFGQPDWIDYDLPADGTKVITGNESDSGDNSAPKKDDSNMVDLTRH